MLNWKRTSAYFKSKGKKQIEGQKKKKHHSKRNRVYVSTRIATVICLNRYAETLLEFLEDFKFQQIIYMYQGNINHFFFQELEWY